MNVALLHMFMTFVTFIAQALGSQHSAFSPRNGMSPPSKFENVHNVHNVHPAFGFSSLQGIGSEATCTPMCTTCTFQ